MYGNGRQEAKQNVTWRQCRNYDMNLGLAIFGDNTLNQDTKLSLPTLGLWTN